MTKPARSPSKAPAMWSTLMLDTGAHTNDVRQLAVVGDTLISAGDCSLRVWDLKQRTLVRRLLGQIGPAWDNGYVYDGFENDGQVLRFAVSPDGLWVVVLKFWRDTALAPQDRGRCTDVQVFELATGNLQAAYRHPGPLFDLDFSPDGRYLALVGNTVLGRKRQVLLQVLAARDLIRGGFGSAPRRVVAATWGSAARADALPAAVRFVPERHGGHRIVVASQRAKGPPSRSIDAAASAGSMTWLRLRGARGVHIEHTQSAPRAIDPSTLAVSAQWALVGAADGGVRVPRFSAFYGYDHEGQLATTQYTESGLAQAMFSPTGTQLVVGLTPNRRSGEKSPPVREGSPGSHGGKLPKGAAMALQEEDMAANDFEPGAGDQTVLTHVYACEGGEFKLRSSYFGHDNPVRALAWLDDRHVLSAGGDNQAIHCWFAGQRIGHYLWAFRGVGRTHLFPGVTADEKVLFGTVPFRLQPINFADRQQSFDLRALVLNTTCASEVAQGDFESDKWNVTLADPLLHLNTNESETGEHLALFVGADDEWVLWTPNGYFAQSANGAQRVGYHLSRGPHQEALYFSSDRFKYCAKRYIVEAVVAHGSEAKARAAGIAIPELDVRDMLPPIVELSAQGIEVQGDRVTLRFTVQTLDANSPVQRIWILRNDRFVWNEDHPKAQARGRYKVELRLLPGRNVFRIKADNVHAISMPVECELTGPPAPVASPAATAGGGNLYLLSVGVSNFKVAGTERSAGFNALRFAHLDATAIYNAFARSTTAARVPAQAPLRNAAFEAVKATLLLDEQAGKQAILTALHSLCDRIKRRDHARGAERDVLMVFLSGHGVQSPDQGDLYFWNFDLDPADLEVTGLSILELGEVLTTVPAEVVLVIDTCYAGQAGSGVLSGLNPEDVAQRLHAVSERGLYILSAARGQELAREGAALGHGVFTSAMLQALKSNRFCVPERGRGKRRSLSMLGLMAAVQELVPSLTAKAKVDAQTPVCRMYGDLLPLTIFRR